MRKQEKEAWDQKKIEVAPPEPFEVAPPEPFEVVTPEPL